MSFEPVPESDGRELTWLKNEFSDTGHYDMFLVRFKSKIVAANFQMSFTCARELLKLGLRSHAAAETTTETAATTAATTIATTADAASPFSAPDTLKCRQESTD